MYKQPIVEVYPAQTLVLLVAGLVAPMVLVVVTVVVVTVMVVVVTVVVVTVATVVMVVVVTVVVVTVEATVAVVTAAEKAACRIRNQFFDIFEQRNNTTQNHHSTARHTR